jgi:hypothetical protein
MNFELIFLDWVLEEAWVDDLQQEKRFENADETRKTNNLIN